jgi:hypothetical protein
MQRRAFIASAATAVAVAPFVTPADASAPRPGPVLLTVSGAIAGANRGPRNALDQLMSKHGVDFERAATFDQAALATLPVAHIEPELEYDARTHRLAGPLLTTVLKAAGVALHDAALTLRAIDGYRTELTLDEARERRYIVATQLDGAPLALGGLGPTWAVFDPARAPDLAGRPLAERFAKCPWGLYHIEVAPA